MNKAIWSVAGLLLVALAGLTLWPQNIPAPQQLTSGIDAQQLKHNPPGSRPASHSMTNDLGKQTQHFNETAFIKDLRQRFTPNLHIKHAQIRSLEQLISYLKAHYPEDWQARVLPMLQTIFPARADELYQRYLSLQRYTAWLKDNRDALKTMSAADRRAALWQAREMAFGEDAQDIWAAELRSQNLADSLHSLPDDLPPVARAQAFRQAINETYGEKAETLLDQRRSELLNQLIQQQPMQQELAALPADQRRQTLREVRASMGMPNDALERWQELDQRRDSAWSNGQAYMQARQQLEQQPPPDMQWRVEQLRQQHFGDMADQIAKEEQAGFFRYAGPRNYGRE